MFATFVSSKQRITSIIICADKALCFDSLVRGDNEHHFNSSNGDIVFARLLFFMLSPFLGEEVVELYSALLALRDLDMPSQLET